VTFDAQAGTTYRIVVGDAGGLRESTFTLKLYNASSTRYTIKDLGTLPGGSFSRAFDINVSGQVVGQADTSTGGRRAFLYSGGQMKDLGTLGGSSSASGINDSGQVVGQSMISNETCSGCYHAFLYSDGQMRDLGTLPGGDASWASGVNDSGQVVGGANTSAGTFRAFLYSGAQMRDLNELIPPGSGWDLTHAWAINTSGQIVGEGYMNGQERAFLATPTQTPRVTSTVPTANATAVDLAANVTATFSEEMDASSINATTFKLFRKNSKKEVDASVRYDATTATATLDPTSPLQRGVSYNAVVSTGAKDLEGNTLEQQHIWSFTVSK
jgi:probable HAF family extracellular repeat protein